MIEGVPAQVIVEPGEALGALPIVAANAEAVLGEIERLTSRGFDVTQAPPIRAELIEVDEEDHVLTVVVHHICADGFSMAPLAFDVMSAYSARHRGEAPDWSPLPVQYPDFAIWQERLSVGSTKRTALLPVSSSTGHVNWRVFPNFLRSPQIDRVRVCRISRAASFDSTSMPASTVV